MNRRVLKILIIMILLFLFFTFCMTSKSNALISSTFNGSTSNISSDDVGKIEKIEKSILVVIRNVSAFIAVAILMIIACKYILASAGDRADIKKYAISYIIGAVILFAASGITQILYQIITGAFSG